MILGDVCTRGCRFCAVRSGNPRGALDLDEPENAARAVARMGARHVVITSVDRDDLEDHGAAHFAATVRACRDLAPGTAVEVLIGDLGGDREALRTVVEARPEVLAHNLETVRRLTPRVRDRRADYEVSLCVLRAALELDPDLSTKSSLMLGLGETEGEVLETMDDLRAAGVEGLTLGQYLQPTARHLEVSEWITPEAFAAYERAGLEKGFAYVASGPLVRSSYKAGTFYALGRGGSTAPHETGSS